MLATALNYVRNLSGGNTIKVPPASSKLESFSIEVALKPGCVLQTRPRGSKETDPLDDVGSPQHLEVTVFYDGRHPLYSKEPNSWTFLLTQTVKNVGEGMNGSVYFLPPGKTFERIEIVERHEEAGFDDFGSRYPAQQIVWVQLYSRGDGGVRKWMGIGIMSRNPR